jgi:hypothetical protein
MQRGMLHLIPFGAETSIGEAQRLGRGLEQPLFLWAHLVDVDQRIASRPLQQLSDPLYHRVIHRQLQHLVAGLGVKGQTQVGIEPQLRCQLVGQQRLVDAIGRGRDDAALVLQVAKDKTRQVERLLAARCLAHSALKSSPNKASS